MNNDTNANEYEQLLKSAKKFNDLLFLKDSINVVQLLDYPEEYDKNEEELFTFDIYSLIAPPDANSAIVSELMAAPYSGYKFLGVFLDLLKKDYPQEFEEVLPIAISSIREDGSMSFNIDAAFIHSTLAVLNETLTKEETHDDAMRFLKIALGQPDEYDEFDCLYNILYQHINDERQSALSYVLDALSNSYEHGSKEESLDNMRKLTYMVLEKGYKVVETDFTSCCDYNNRIIKINDVYGTDVTALHELGHAIDFHYHRRPFYTDDIAKLESAKKRIMYNPKSLYRIKECNERVREVREEARKNFREDLKTRYGSVRNAKKELEEKVSKSLNEEALGALFSKYNVPAGIREKLFLELKNEELDKTYIAAYFYKIIEYNFTTNYISNMVESSFLDIISSIFGGTSASIGKIPIPLEYNHPSNYYQKNPEYRMMEIMANMNVLLVSDDKKHIGYLRELVGDEFVDSLIEERSVGRAPNLHQKNESKKVA